MTRKITKNDKLFFFEKNFFTLDGLWIIEIENATNFETALKIDIKVWQKLYKIIFRRVKNYLKISTNALKDLIDVISFCWSCEGYKYKIVKLNNREAILNIFACPYKAIMDRNPERREKVKAICIEMCVPFYEPALKEFNSKIDLRREKFLGAGDSVCDFHFNVKNN
jgi:hypothetical protein